MKEKAIVTTILMILVLSLVPILGDWNPQVERSSLEYNTETLDFVELSYDVHSPITINDNGDFITGGFPGNGSESNPYRIENLNISSTTRCIWIEDITVYYVITNCFLTSTSTTYSNIDIFNAPNGIIEDTLIFGGDEGIVMNYAPGSRIENVTVTDSDWMGVYVGYSNGTSIIDVEVSGCQSTGIFLTSSDSLYVLNCTIYDIDYDGMYLNLLIYSEVVNCSIFDCGHNGMQVRSQHCLISGNTIHDNARPGIDVGINCYEGYNCTFYDNEVYNIPSTGIRFSQSVACNATGNRVHDNEVGIASSNSQNTIISHNRIFGNGWGAGGEQGVYIGWSTDCLVSHNKIWNNSWYGIYSYLSNDSRIEYNEIYDNEYDNLYFIRTYDCNFTGNTIRGGSTGLQFIDSSGARVIDNIICDASSFGLDFFRTNSSWAYMNDLAWNGYDVWNARENDCFGIHWDNNVTDGVGNWWGDYDGSPTYVTRGDGGIDHFPHISLNASIAAPIEVEYGSTGNIMNWTQASARNPSHYEVYADGALFENVTWDGFHIEVNVDSLDFGYYEMNLTVYHVTGHSANSISYANVTDTTSPVWDVAPTNQVAEYAESFMYNVSATDLRGVIHYTLNDTSYFSISDQGSITNTSQVPIGIHDLEIRAYDPSSLSCIAFITITVSDTIAPSWNMTIEPQVVEYGDSFSYQLGATDISGIQNWLVNDTIHFTIVDGLITNITALDAGTYFVNVSIEDIYGNTLFEVFTVTVSDTTSPTWTMTPENQVLEYGESLSYQLGATDLSDIGMWYVNDTAHFSIVDGLLTNLGTLEPGIYHLEITVEDIYGNPLTVLISVTIGEQPITTPTTTTTTAETTTTTTTTSETTTTTTTATGTPDNTMMIVILGGVGAAVLVVIVIVAMKKRS